MDIQKFKRGQVWWCNLDLMPNTNIQGGRRPVIIVSNDNANRYSNNITIVPCTTADKKELPTHLKINLAEQSTVLAECVTTIPNTKLENYIGICDDRIMKQIDKILKVALGLADFSDDKVEIVLNSKPLDVEQLTKTLAVNPISIDNTSLEEKLSTRKAYKGVGRKGYQKYTKEDMIRFINDCENHTIEWVTKKYNCSSEKATSNKLYRFRKFLKENP